jgi:hypothetical protein
VAREVFLAIRGVYNGRRWVCRGSWIASAIGFDVGTSCHRCWPIEHNRPEILFYISFRYTSLDLWWQKDSTMRIANDDLDNVEVSLKSCPYLALPWCVFGDCSRRGVELAARIARSIVWTHAQNTLCYNFKNYEFSYVRVTAVFSFSLNEIFLLFLVASSSNPT